MGLFGDVGVEEVFGVGAVEFVLCGDASVGIEIECEGRAGVGVIPLVGCVEGQAVPKRPPSTNHRLAPMPSAVMAWHPPTLSDES